MEKKKILLVDDVLLFLHLQVSFLGRNNYDLHVATTGERGLAKAFEVIPDLILLDYVMPGMNGAEVCWRLKHDPRTKHIPIVIISSRSGDEEKEAAQAAGCDSILYKPVRREVLISTVEGFLKAPRRRCTRMNVHLPCEVKGPQGTSPGMICSLSHMGLLVETDATFLPGEVLCFEFSLGGADLVCLTGAVMWTGHGSDFGKLRAGVEFSSPPARERELLHGFMEIGCHTP